MHCGKTHPLQITTVPTSPRKVCSVDISVSTVPPGDHLVCSYLLLGSQLTLAKKYHLPLFLHSRAAHSDFVQILREEGFGEDGGKAVGGKGGVVHSFTGTPEEAAELVRSFYSCQESWAPADMEGTK